MYHLEEVSLRVRHLHSGAIAAARGMGLHAIDRTPGRAKEEMQEQIINVEVRTRLLWHLAATDWILALCGGPQEGTYAITPKQMHVNIPRNIKDDDLRTCSATCSRPVIELTSMSY